MLKFLAIFALALGSAQAQGCGPDEIPCPNDPRGECIPTVSMNVRLTIYLRSTYTVFSRIQFAKLILGRHLEAT